MGRLRVTPVTDDLARARVLQESELALALRLCAVDPVGSVLVAARVEAAISRGLWGVGGEFWGFFRAGELVGLCWAGSNICPVVPGDADEALDAFAELTRAQGRRSSSIVGEASLVLGLWSRLAHAWSRPREIRSNQPSLMIDHDPTVVPDAQVRQSLPEDFPLLLPACVAMFEEEVGYTPSFGVGGPYETRVRALISTGMSFSRIDETPAVAGPGRRHEVLFKAEVGACAGGVAQIQGVWVAPRYRGRRLSESGMAAVVVATRQRIAPVVSLYVNSYNTRALSAYKAVGFRQVGTFATVLF
jgi:uncharacterized protein